jgi:hypothetical protein
VTADFAPTDTINFNSLTDASAGNLVINPKAVDVYADPGQYKFVVDSDPAELTYAVFPALFGSDTLSGTLSRAAGEGIGTYSILNAAPLSNLNYAITYHGADFAIIPSMTGFAPADDAFLPIRRPTFTWDPAYFSGTPSGYTIEYSVNDDMLAPAKFSTGLTPAFTPAADLLANKLYFWHVRAVYSDSTLSPWARTFSFTTGNPPTMPVLSLPVDKALVVQNATGDFAPLLKWGASKLPLPVDSTIFEKYTVLIDDDPGFGSPIERDVDGIATLQYQVLASDGLLTNSRYYWKVLAYNNVDGELHYAPSLVRTFTTPVDIPTPLLPVNTTAYIISKRPTFSWTSEANALSYNIQLSLKPITTAAGVATYSNISSPFMPPADLAGNSTYYWRVQSNSANGRSAWSEVFTFKTGVPPTRPALFAPAYTALVSASAPLKLDWTTVIVVAPSTFSYYEVQVSTSPLFTTTVVNSKSLTAIATSEITLPALTLNLDTRYYWRVKSVGSGGSSPWSSTRYFRTQLVSPTLLTPANLATGVSKLAGQTFTWDQVLPVSGIVSGYNLQVSTTPTFTVGTVPVNVWIRGASNSSYTTIASLLPNKVYYWRVRATGTNTGGWTVFSFTTGP